ncbi:MAG: colanic acid biosynthesis acetyltransferase WcaF [Phormidesmis sp. RL_2_1]|nr:colanic acid biosynthesis acetyltransferase WcaF [Phormidesmis sp. RL_2_1]
MGSSSVQLAKYTPLSSYNAGASFLAQLLWFYIGSPLLMAYWLPFSGLKVRILRLFGAAIGAGVRIKPGVRVKFPWRLSVGDSCWLGENVWIDNLAPVVLDHNVCLSQGVYLCTGNHDWSKPTFDLRTGAIRIEHSAWIGAKAVVGPKVTVGEGAVLSLGSVASASLACWTIYAGNPAQPIKKRHISPAVD